MKAVFYDRNNNQIVTSEELIPINFVEYYVIMDNNVTPIREDEIHVKEKPIAEYGYKGKDCSRYNNWDLVTSTKDLIFLRLE